MIIHDKRKAVTAIMSKRRTDGSVDSAPMVPSIVKNEDTSADGRHAAAEDVLSAINEKHPGKLMDALANFHDLHSMKPEEPEEKV